MKIMKVKGIFINSFNNFYINLKLHRNFGLHKVWLLSILSFDETKNRPTRRVENFGIYWSLINKSPEHSNPNSSVLR